jgi:hypothetical protein
MIKKKMLVTPTKKLTPATIINQKKWASFPLAKKNQLRKMLPDKDKDCVPNKYDCQPNNRRKQEGFYSQDIRYLESKPAIKLKKKLGEGTYGEFYSIEGSNRLGVKIPRCPIREGRPQDCSNCNDKQNIIKEGMNCYNNNYNGKTLLSDTYIIPVKIDGRECVGLVRPLVTPMMNGNARSFTDSQLRMIHEKLLQLTKQGICLDDGIQCGLAADGKILQFDLDCVKYNSGNRSNTFKINREMWITFLNDARGPINKVALNNAIYNGLELAIHEATNNNNAYELSELMKIQKLLGRYGDI